MKHLTLENLQADRAFADVLEWIAPLLERGGPTEEEWLDKPHYWARALLLGYDVSVSLALARLYPYAALQRSKWQAKSLSDATIIALAWMEPWAGLVYALDRLPDEVVIELARLEPWLGLKCAIDRLPDDVVIELARREPLAGLWFASLRLPDDVYAALRCAVEQAR